ncbi:MAG: hypothetical protein D6739_09500, partial [Nitrospirae bacterium]
GYPTYLTLLPLGLATTAFLLSVPLPERGLGRLAALSPYLLGIYVLHTYLFVPPSLVGPLPGLLLSLGLTLAAAVAAKRLAVWLRGLLVRPRPAPAAAG